MLSSKALIALFSVFVLASCTGWDLDKLRKSEIKGGEFHKVLASHYLKFSEAEADNYDWWSSQYFARKGLLVAYGNKIEPENLADWKVAETAHAELSSARTKLVNALKKDGAERIPAKTADAIFYFDCWLENMHEGWQVNDINGCRGNFYESQDAITASDAVKSEWTIYFQAGSSGLSKAGKQVISEVMETLQSGSYEVIINGHTDKEGSPEANMKLGMRRASEVKNSLVEGGAEASRISTTSFGETDPSTTAKSNRRVEIFINE